MWLRPLCHIPPLFSKNYEKHISEPSSFITMNMDAAVYFESIPHTLSAAINRPNKSKRSESIRRGTTAILRLFMGFVDNNKKTKKTEYCKSSPLSFRAGTHRSLSLFLLTQTHCSSPAALESRPHAALFPAGEKTPALQRNLHSFTLLGNRLWLVAALTQLLSSELSHVVTSV